MAYKNDASHQIVDGSTLEESNDHEASQDHCAKNEDKCTNASDVIPCEEDASISDSSVTTSVPALSDIQLSHSHHGIYSLEPNNILVPPQQLDDHNETVLEAVNIPEQALDQNSVQGHHAHILELSTGIMSLLIDDTAYKGPVKIVLEECHFPLFYNEMGGPFVSLHSHSVADDTQSGLFLGPITTDPVEESHYSHVGGATVVISKAAAVDQRNSEIFSLV